MWRALFVSAVAFGCQHNGATFSDAAAGGDAPIGDAASSDAATMIDAGTGDAGVYPSNAPPTGACMDGWCWVDPLPQGWPLTGVWGTGPTDLWAFAFQSKGAVPAYLHFDGAQWTTSLTASACSATGGPSWGNVPTRGNGPCPGSWNSSWTASSDGGTPVGGLGANDYWNGSRGTTSHWNGTNWTAFAAPTVTWTPLAFGGSGGTTIMVSDGGGIAQWTGTVWGVADGGTHPANAGVVIDATHVAIAQAAGAVSIWSAGTWSTITAPIAANWDHILASSPTDIWVAAAYQGVASFCHWDGAIWTHADTLTANAFYSAIWRDATGALWIATDSGQVLVWNGSAWTAKTIGDNGDQDVSGTGWDDIWTLSPTYPQNRPSHWDGTAWTDIAFPFPPDPGNGTGYTVSALWASAKNDVWIAGGHAIDEENISRTLFHWDGLAWTAMGPFGTEDYEVSAGFNRIWGAAPNDVYALGTTALYHYDGASWTSVDAVAGGNAVFGSGSNDVYVANGTTLWRWDGTSWTMKTMPAATYYGWANSPTDVWMDSYHYDGSLFVPVSTPGLAAGTAIDMFVFADTVVGLQQTEYVGGFNGTPQTTAMPIEPSRIWRTPDGHLFAAGSGLMVH